MSDGHIATHLDIMKRAIAVLEDEIHELESGRGCEPVQPRCPACRGVLKQHRGKNGAPMPWLRCERCTREYTLVWRNG